MSSEFSGMDLDNDPCETSGLGVNLSNAVAVAKSDGPSSGPSAFGKSGPRKMTCGGGGSRVSVASMDGTAHVDKRRRHGTTEEKAARGGKDQHLQSPQQQRGTQDIREGVVAGNKNHVMAASASAAESAEHSVVGAPPVGLTSGAGAIKNDSEADRQRPDSEVLATAFSLPGWDTAGVLSGSEAVCPGGHSEASCCPDKRGGAVPDEDTLRTLLPRSFNASDPPQAVLALTASFCSDGSIPDPTVRLQPHGGEGLATMRLLPWNLAAGLGPVPIHLGRSLLLPPLPSCRGEGAPGGAGVRGWTQTGWGRKLSGGPSPSGDLSSVMHIMAAEMRAREADNAFALRHRESGAMGSKILAAGRSFCRLDMSQELSVISAGGCRI